VTAAAATAVKKSALASVQAAEQHVLLPTYDRYKVLLRRGKGVWLYDAEGKKYLDFLSGIGVNALGYAHPAVVKAIRKQTATGLLHISNLFFHDFQAELAEKLAKISGMERAFFTNSGTEAVEGALKLARAYAKAKTKTGKPKWRVLALENSFHGRTMGAVATTWTKKYREPFGPLMPGVEFVKFDDVADLEKKFDASVCAILLEPLQGEGGIHLVSPAFLKKARALTQKSGALLIADEIQCGMGRTGKWFAYQWSGVKPDVVTLAKPIAGGLPLGAILCTQTVADVIHPGMHGTTFGGGPLACAVAVTVLDVIEKQHLLAHNAELGAYMRGKLEALAARHAVVKEVRGKGLMMGVELRDAEAAKFVAKAMLDNGVVANRTHEVVIRLLPPFIVEKKHVDIMAKAFDKALSQWESQQQSPKKSAAKSRGGKG
jgi:acetylornithine aminotransferase/acetylornithine/N-succinyldiaminopimelate aminotransferase